MKLLGRMILIFFIGAFLVAQAEESQPAEKLAKAQKTGQGDKSTQTGKRDDTKKTNTGQQKRGGLTANRMNVRGGLTVQGVDVLEKFSDIDKELKALKQAGSNPSSSGSSSKSNPDISVNLLILGQKTFPTEESQSDSPTKKEIHDHSREGLSIQEVEFYFKSNIDPYWSGTISFGIFPASHDHSNSEDVTSNGGGTLLQNISPSTSRALKIPFLTNHQKSSAFQVELEEAYIESLFIPSLTLKAGLFYATLGRHNELHTHHYPFIDTPIANKKIFDGDHGFRETGLSVAYLSPLPWYSELIGQAFYSYEDKKTPFSGLLFFKNLWDLYQNSTFEFNVSYGSGIKNFKHLFNSALVLKWQSLESSNRKALSWTTELILATEKESVKNKIGAHSYIQWQFLKNWHLQFRADGLMPEGWDRDKERRKYSTLLSFAPTEYSAIRLQGDIEKSEYGKWSYGVSIQSNMSLGAHPAHLY